MKAHRTFTRCVADNFERAIETGAVVYDEEIEGLANDITELSANVSANVDIMRERLQELVEALESAQKKPKNKKALLKSKAWVWLRRAVQVFAVLLGAAATISAVAFQSSDCGMVFSAGAALLKGTAMLMEKIESKRAHHNLSLNLLYISCYEYSD